MEVGRVEKLGKTADVSYLWMNSKLVMLPYFCHSGERETEGKKRYQFETGQIFNIATLNQFKNCKVKIGGPFP